ncbi:Low molecular weight protein-tyrosine-phosphatase YwlE [Rosistilla oblonga]|uniref:Sua5/YciO/YrdC/YwlC family protein n=1 Tax=Rosistilla oblonga TaxID=2527990 RepID=UPI00118CC06A|nr:Sua5/YciO/YrdC/YwlC family protein [Rosistilla oblonga]QDV14905.1 Low molecular weight protein-tyrosine-phosphatase YwlE [Rosistilla oblonga]
MPTVIDLQRAEDPRDIVYLAVQALAEGKVIALPTETVYGLAASVLCADAVQRMTELKRKLEEQTPTGGKPRTEYSLAIAVKSADEAIDYMCHDSPLAIRFARRCWPGPVTLVVPCDPTRSAASCFPEAVRELVVSQSGHIGVRVVAHRLFEQLQKYCAGPIVICSANRCGSPSTTTGVAVVEQFGDDVPLVVDDGPTRYGGPSTVVRANGNQFKIIREGVVETAAIRQYARPSIVLVCTGNTCRSPMAEALLKKRIDERFGNSPSGAIIPSVSSVGLAAMPGDQAATQAVDVMRERGLDISGHESQPFGEQTIRSADLILTMTRSHRNAILQRWPHAQDRVFTVRRDGGDISDPVGSPVQIYQACADQIDRELAQWVESLGPEWLAISESGEEGENQ